MSAAALISAGHLRGLALFLASFGATLVIQGRGHGHTDLSRDLAAALASPQSSMHPAMQIPSMADAVAAPSSQAPPDETVVSPPGLDHDQYSALIETAMTDDDDESRRAAILQLSRAPAEEAIAALEQVLRTDSDQANRSLAMQVLVQLPAAALARSSLLPLLREFMNDADGNIATLAREGYERLMAT